MILSTKSTGSGFFLMDNINQICHAERLFRSVGEYKGFVPAWVHSDQQPRKCLEIAQVRFVTTPALGRVVSVSFVGTLLSLPGIEFSSSNRT
jgi:hypothetical protein